jgi:ArsR family transcriptional regulator
MDKKRPNIVELAAVMKALSDPTRLVILDLLMEGVQCNCYLGDRLGLPINLISHHLKVLRQAGLVQAERDPLDARWIYYSVDQDKLVRLRGQLSAFLDPGRIQSRLPMCGPRFAPEETAHTTS